MLTTQNIAIILFCIPVYQLIFYTVQLMTFKRTVNRARWNLGLLLLSLSIFLIISALFYLDYQRVLSWSYFMFAPVFLVLVPLYYNYLRNITGSENSGFWGNALVLFLPAILVLILNIFTYGKLPYIEKLLFLFSGFGFLQEIGGIHFSSELVFLFGFVFLACLQISLYSFKVFQILNTYNAGSEKDASNRPFVQTRWLAFIFISLVSFMLINIGFHLISNGVKISVLLIYNVLMIITGALIGYLGMKQENLYDYINRLSYIEAETSDNQSNRNKERAVTVANEEETAVFDALINLMETKKLYLDSNLTIDELAKRLNVNKRIISITVNDKLNTNIYGFINDYRIRQSKEIISDPSMHYLSMEGIAQKVGFKSKSCFYASFKKVTGQTPTQFKKEDQK